jgi:hypothetical protein
VEAAELRVGHAEKERLDAIQTLARHRQLIPLPNLLRSQPNDFLVNNAAARQRSERHYLNAWALSHYLMFERRVIGTPAMDQYVQALKRGTNELTAFRNLVNQPLDKFELEYYDYILRLKADGTLAKKAR